MRTWLLCGAGAAALAAAQPALAAQCATVSFSPSSVVVPNWDPITPAAQQSSFTMTVTRQSPNTTGIRLMFLDSNDQSQPVRLGTNGGQSGPPYQVLDSTGTNVVYPAGGSVTTLKGQPAFTWLNKNSNNTVSANFRILVPANSQGTDFSNGTYGETLNYSIQCLNNGNSTNVVDGPVSGPAVSLVVPNLVSLTTAHAATLDFQNFTSLSQQLNIGLKSTGPVSVQVDSTYKLKMVRAGAPPSPPDNSTIPYEMSLKGQNVGPLPATLSYTRAGVAGATWPLILSLTVPPSGKIAGSYSDTITVTLKPGS
jgi:hypothetical protein